MGAQGLLAQGEAAVDALDHPARVARLAALIEGAADQAKHCRRLWAAVLGLALEDAHGWCARGKTDKTGMAAFRARSQGWIGTRDFREVCDLAGVDHAALLDRLAAGRVAFEDRRKFVSNCREGAPRPAAQNGGRVAASSEAREGVSSLSPPGAAPAVSGAFSGRG